jgi:hypothetical protein
MMIRTRMVAVVFHTFAMLLGIAVAPQSTFAQSPPADVPAPAKVPENLQSQLVDDPVVFRLVQLAFVEESLKAVDAATQKASGRSNTSAKKAEYYDKNNEKMDRQGGGPVPWYNFYGRSPEKFFYHPRDRGTVYVNPNPKDQRPPQFDYIYRANEQQAQKAKDQIAALGGKIEKLRERKRNLEQEQVALWTRVSAAMVAKCELRERPLYMYHLTVVKADDVPAEAALHRAKAVEALTEYLRIIDRSLVEIDELVSSDAKSSFKLLKQNAEIARYGLVKELTGINDRSLGNQIDPLSDIAKRLAVTANSAFEVHNSALEADAANDDQRRLASRGLLQTAVFDLADKSNSLDEGVIKLAEEWNVQPVRDKARPEVKLVSLMSTPAPMQEVAKPVDKFQVGSVWNGVGPQGGYKFTLEVVAREGEKFIGRYVADALKKGQKREGENKVEGTISNGNIQWHKEGVENEGRFSGTINGDEISVRPPTNRRRAPLILRREN